MAKNLKQGKIQSLNLNFTPVGNLVAPKLPQYSYFGLLSGASGYKESGKKLQEVYYNNSFVNTDYIAEQIPIVKKYSFVNKSNNTFYVDFANLYVSGGINTIITNIKDFVRLELPARVQQIILTVDEVQKEQAKTNLKNYLSNDFLRDMVKTVVSESNTTLFNQVLTFLLSPQTILNIQYNYMLQEVHQENGGPCTQMKEGVRSVKWTKSTNENRTINAINETAQRLLANNKALYQNCIAVNNQNTSVQAYINTNLDELFKYLGSTTSVTINQTQTGADLSNELNFKPDSKGGNKNTKSKGINLTTILLLAIPIAIFLIKKQK
ncbi:MAG: hypothetical protein U0L93_05985 [Bacteroidales bacterium]|nr:hypothetical protein [Bacteroidales bacterium]